MHYFIITCKIGATLSCGESKKCCDEDLNMVSNDQETKGIFMENITKEEQS